FSPYTIWLPLTKDMTGKVEKTAAIQNFYKKLNSDQREADLVRTAQALQSGMIHSRGDQNFHSLSQAFLDGNIDSLGPVIYVAEMGIFTYLLQSIGFVIGIHPQFSSVLGPFPQSLFPNAREIFFAQQTTSY